MHSMMHESDTRFMHHTLYLADPDPGDPVSVPVWSAPYSDCYYYYNEYNNIVSISC